MSAMQKTYDDCYLICSTAVFFESQVKSIVAVVGAFVLTLIRTMSQRLYDPGGKPSTRSLSQTLQDYPLDGSPKPRQKERYGMH